MKQLLVHGSCHGEWCWNKLISFMKEKCDTDIYASTFTGLGERNHLLYKDINLSTHIKDIVQVFEYQNLNDVVLIGHSYGGIVIGGVAERIPNSIISMILMHIFHRMAKCF